MIEKMLNGNPLGIMLFTFVFLISLLLLLSLLEPVSKWIIKRLDTWPE